MPLALGLVDADKREVVMGHLVDAIRGNKYMVTRCQIYVCGAGADAGGSRGDVMYAMMTQDAGPGVCVSVESWCDEPDGGVGGAVVAESS